MEYIQMKRLERVLRIESVGATAEQKAALKKVRDEYNKRKSEHDRFQGLYKKHFGKRYPIEDQ